MRDIFQKTKLMMLSTTTTSLKGFANFSSSRYITTNKKILNVLSIT